MAEWTIEAALRMALEIEQDNFSEYERSAAEASNPGVKSMFRFLAGEERKHIQLIREKMAQFRIEP